ncbi:MAG: hypothetical protein GX371_01770, partial [Bacteroidales bacterium]|nr:hypothetical protein [Bacteroidales bacterium]
MSYLQQITIATLVFLSVISCTPTTRGDSTTNIEKAVPVWAEGREKEMNLNLGFRGSFTAEEAQNAQIKIAASTLYRMYVNGHFIGSGPARAAHGYFRIDEFPVG